MSNERVPITTLLIIGLLIANLGLSAYIAFRPVPSPAPQPPKEPTTSAVSKAEADTLAESLIPLYNQKSASSFYDRFDPLAKVQFTQIQLAQQIEKLGSVLGLIEACAYSHATIAGDQGGRTYYTLHYKVSLRGGPMPTGNMTLTVVRNADGLGLFGFFINGGSR